MGVRCIRRTASHPVTPSLRHPFSPSPRPAFTLVEMLTVIVIIGILAGLITAAAIRARGSVRITVVRTEIGDLQKALESYKLAYNEYPPDFAPLYGLGPSLAPVCNQNSLSGQAVLRHLQTAYPRYFEALFARGGVDDTTRWNLFKSDLAPYGLNPDYFDPATAMIFWLGGLPQQVPSPVPGTAGQAIAWIPAGFNADKTNLFGPPAGVGSPRTEPYFTFTGTRLLAYWEKFPTGVFLRLRYYPPATDQAPTPPAVEQPGPYVYFRARRDQTSGRFEYGRMLDASNCNPFYFAYLNTGNVCVPYMNGDLTTDPRPWCDREKYQIITSGNSDGWFGNSGSGIFRNVYDGTGISTADFDNITSFASGKLEDLMPK